MHIIPDIQTFRERAKQGNVVPVCREILADQDTPVSMYDRLRTAMRAGGDEPYTFLFESVEGGEQLARYSFIGGRPRAVFRAFGNSVEIESHGKLVETREADDPLTVLQDFMAPFKLVHDSSLPRFSGGAVGYLGYDSVSHFDRVPLSEGPGLGVPDMLFAIADSLIVFDQVKHTVKLVANAFIDEEDSVEAAYEHAVERLQNLSRDLCVEVPRRIVDAHLPVPEPELSSNFEHQAFIDSVERCKEYIRAGDIIQVVPSQRFEMECRADALDVYRALRAINPSPYLFCLEFGEVRLVGSSPEIHVRSEEGSVRIRPIAGTRHRASCPVEDQRLEEELLADPKERAEHVMLVDLARNDIGRVCKWGSVEVSEFMIIERYSHVMHIVSDVVGELSEHHNVYDLMRATFPAGTLTGAPKIRAMEIIAEIEPTKRGPYGGAVGYFGFDGNLDCCITIRTVLLHEGKAYVQAGAGVVADSDPQKEYEETQNKAGGMLRAVEQARRIGAGNEGLNGGNE